MNERELCYKVLYEIHYNDALSHLAIKKALDECDMRGENINKAFVTRLVNGEIEKHLTLMFLITHQANRPEGKIKPALRIIMAEALYQAIYMSVPVSAAVNEAVKLAKKHRFMNLSGFVNGVLRKCIEGYEKFIAENSGKDINDYLVYLLEKNYVDRSESYKLSIIYSCPEWLVNHFLQYMSVDELKRMFDIRTDNDEISVYRLESKASEEEFLDTLAQAGVTARKLDITPNLYRLSNVGDIKKQDFFKKGMAIVQDASSAKEGELLPIVENAKVLDVCAAPGGKAIHAADKLLKHGASILACDLTAKKVKLIDDTIKRCELTNIKTQVNDASVYNAEFKEQFDIVIADLPCSGLGVIFKKTDIKYKTTFDDTFELASIQKSIIDNVVKYVKPGGYIIYSTCTLAEQENEDNARYIAAKGYTLVKEETMLPNEDQDGFYIALLKRN